MHGALLSLFLRTDVTKQNKFLTSLFEIAGLIYWYDEQWQNSTKSNQDGTHHGPYPRKIFNHRDHLRCRLQHHASRVIAVGEIGAVEAEDVAFPVIGTNWHYGKRRQFINTNKSAISDKEEYSRFFAFRWLIYSETEPTEAELLKWFCVVAVRATPSHSKHCLTE